MHIYEETGIRSYNLATSGQPTALSYERLKAALANQSPKLVILDASALFFGKVSNGDEGQWRKVMNSIPWSHFMDRWNGAKTYVEEKKLEMDSIIDWLIPLLRFHTNYLTDKDDDDIELEDEALPYYRKGHVLRGIRTAAGAYWGGTFEDMLQEYVERNKVSKNGTDYSAQLQESLSDNEEKLKKIKDLCDENQCELILTKIPVHTSYLYSGHWSREKHEAVAQLADHLNIQFIDLNDFDLIDWQNDSIDGGRHMNVRGAMKVSTFLGEWLLENYEFAPEADVQLKKDWDAQLQIYKSEEKYALLQAETDFKEYLSTVKEGDYTLLAAVADTIGYQWGDELEGLFQDVTGAEISMQGKSNWAYVNVSSDGVLLDEKADSLTCSCRGKLQDGRRYSVTSKGYYVGSGASITIDGVEYVSTGRGIRFVVYDNELGCVVDSVTFDTHSDGLGASRNNYAYWDAFYEKIVNRVKLMNEVD